MMFSVVTPTYNRPESLRRLIDSIRRQTYTEFEIIVVDDASNFEELNKAIVEEAQASGIKARYLRHNTNKGAPAARNTGIEHATGTWIAFVDDDDEWDATKLERQATEIASAAEDVGIVYCWARYLDGKGQKVGGGYSRHQGHATAAVFRGNFMASPTVVVRRSVFDEVGVFDTELTSCQDWDMWSRILAAGYSCKLIQEELATYYIHDGDTITKSTRAPYGYKRYIEKHFINILKYTTPINWGHKVYLYSRAIAQIIRARYFAWLFEK